MNDVELKALEIKRKAWEVLDGKAEVDVLFQELYRLERQSQEFFDAVAKQLEEDNGRWAPTSALPNAEIRRDASTKRIEEISFHALEPYPVQTSHAALVSQDQTDQNDHNHEEFTHISVSKSAEDELNRSFQASREPLSVIVWRSDFGDRAWIEDFAKDLNDGKKHTDEGKKHDKH